MIEEMSERIPAPSFNGKKESERFPECLARLFSSNLQESSAVQFPTDLLSNPGLSSRFKISASIDAAVIKMITKKAGGKVFNCRMVFLVDGLAYCSRIVASFVLL
ncbi:MAG: hypothetical protein ILNGONEN_00688 [Syntrophorhabdaceae bacterium]|nr:hypothetical protein [Syntrophorhabdaceae bacterium]